jgi:hypothetical protein
MCFIQSTSRHIRSFRTVQTLSHNNNSQHRDLSQPQLPLNENRGRSPAVLSPSGHVETWYIHSELGRAKYQSKASSVSQDLFPCTTPTPTNSNTTFDTTQTHPKSHANPAAITMSQPAREPPAAPSGIDTDVLAKINTLFLRPEAERTPRLVLLHQDSGDTQVGACLNFDISENLEAKTKAASEKERISRAKTAGLNLSLTTENERVKKAPWWLQGMSAGEIPDEIPKLEEKKGTMAKWKTVARKMMKDNTASNDFEFDTKAFRLPPPLYSTDLSIPGPETDKNDTTPPHPHPPPTSTDPEDTDTASRTKSLATREFARNLPTAPRKPARCLPMILLAPLISFIRSPAVIEHSPEDIQKQAAQARIKAKLVKVGKTGRKNVVVSIRVGRRTVPFKAKHKRVRELLRETRNDITEDIYEVEIKKALGRLRERWMMVVLGRGRKLRVFVTGWGLWHD